MEKLFNYLFKTAIVCMIIFSIYSCKKDNITQTLPVLVSNTTSDINLITRYSATISSIVTDDGGSPISARGVCWSIHEFPDLSDFKTNDGSGSGKFTSLLTGLSANTTYNVCSYATNSLGTTYSNPLNLTTLPESGDTVIDIDGNIYYTVTIGTQVWLSKNLNTTRYRNGDSIPNDTISKNWLTSTTGSYSNFNNYPDNALIYGRLYNWFAVNDSRKIAPLGWHVASYKEWSKLVSYLGGERIAGGKLKETGTTHWLSPNTGATDEYGFKALPGGCFLPQPYGFYSLQVDGRWWTSTAEGDGGVWFTTMFFNDINVNFHVNGQGLWYSVRCVRD